VFCERARGERVAQKIGDLLSGRTKGGRPTCVPKSIVEAKELEERTPKKKGGGLFVVSRLVEKKRKRGKITFCCGDFCLGRTLT